MSQDSLLIKKMAELIDKGETFALATVVDVEGSSPGKPGFKMLIMKDGSTLGTVGGGSLEERVKKIALDVIKERKPRKVELALVEEGKGGVGMLCGGKATVFIDVIGKSSKVVIVGGGHLAEAIASLSKKVGFNVIVIDPYATTERFPSADRLIRSGPEEALKDLSLDEETYLVVLGEHEFDVPSLKETLKTPVKYIGMIGSRRRIATAFKKILELGFEKEDLKKVYAPVGLDIGAETPEEIAISILAEILAVKKGGSLRHLREVKKVEVKSA